MNTANNIGLSPEEVLKYRSEFGRNSLLSKKKNSFRIFYDVFKEPMMILLIVAASIYFFTGENEEGFLMLAAIGIVAGISIYQEIRSENATSALKEMTQPLIVVIRNGEKISIPSEELVVNDLIIVSEGEHISADATILDSNDCSVNESILTGESFPVSKNEKDPLLFAGTVMVSGLAHAKVLAVGASTRLGKLGQSMEEIEKEKTPLQMQISLFVRRMALFGGIAFLFVWGYNYWASGDVIHGLLHGLTMAMAALPEEIPVALSTFMALGAYRMIRNNVLTKHPQTVEALGSATVICVDKTGTLTENKMALVELYQLQKDSFYSLETMQPDEEAKLILEYSLFASEPVPFDPMEKAIHEAFLAQSPLIKPSEFKMVHEYPLSGIHPMMTHIYEHAGGRKVIACKGAPEGIVKKSTLSAAAQASVLLKVEELASKGYRVLAVAHATDENSKWPEKQEEFDWVFLGLIAFSDPPRKNSKVVIQNFQNAGIEVKMITGDFPTTAKSIATQVGIRNPEFILTGSEIMAMNEKELEESVIKVNLYARMLPEAKLKVIQALKRIGEVVAMTGDGVNDGPALKAAHIGVAMGKRGSEIARQAASLILIDDDLGNMVTAIGLGRKIYTNLKKAIQYIISIHIPLISVVTIPLILGWKYLNIFSPIHVIFLELVMGPTCSIAFENEPMEKDVMTQKPRKLSTTFFTWRELSVSIVQGLAITFGLMVVMYFSIDKGYTEPMTRTLVFSTLIFSNILLTLTSRSKTDSLITGLKTKNNLIPLMIGITLVILALALYFAPVRNLFQFVPINSIDLVYCSLVAFVSVIWVEIVKFIRNKKSS